MFAAFMIQMKHSLCFTIGASLTILCMAIVSSCANIVPPAGGPRDSLPPRLMSALPKDSATNVTGKNILLTFDEFVTLRDVNANLIVSPIVQNLPLVDYKLRNVTVKFKDTLEPNTTYTLQFGNSIVDVNEGNIAKDFSYVFSTGRTIDRYTYSGKVLLAESGKVDSTLIVVLHNNLSDTSIQKKTPRYFARVNGQGEFSFRNLPGSNFAAYVLPNGFTKKYDDSTSMFGFLNTPVSVYSGIRTDTFYVFEEFKPMVRAGSNNNRQTVAADKRLRYMPQMDNGQQDLLSDLELNFNRKIKILDTAGIVLYDTNYVKIPGYRVFLDTSLTKLTVQYPWKPSSALRLLLAANAVADSAGTQLPKADTLRFFTKREADYGSIRFRFNNLDLSKNPVLQLVQSDRVVESFVITQPVLTRNRYKPGTYELRVLFDTNKNGIWNTGSYRKKLQPEVVKLLVPGQLTIRANWDNEVSISL